MLAMLNVLNCANVRMIALPLFEGYPVVVKGSGQVNEIPIS